MNATALAAALLVAATVTAVWALGNFEAPADTNAAATGQQFATGSAHRRDTPNDPDYDCAEQDSGLSNSCSNLYDQSFDLFGFASGLTRLTTLYKDPTDTVRFGQPQISGYNASGAWKIERGRPDVSVAVLDTGIRWNSTKVRQAIRLNRGELPLPQQANGSTLAPTAANQQGYDLNGDGAFNVDDYASDPRVNKSAGPAGVAGMVDGQDLIVTFSDGVDADNNAFIDDIAGWDFFDGDNDPNDASSYFAAGNHGTGRMEEVAERGNDGQGGIGVCPKCQIVPIRIWDTFVSDGSSFGLGILYAADNGVSVVEGANGSLTHTSFTEAASAYAWQKGLVQTYSGDDLNTGNHNYPANYTHAMLIEGTVPDNQGLGQNSAEFQQARDFFCQMAVASMCPGSNAPVGTYFRSANTAQFGAKSSISMWGSTGSQNTGRAAGAAGLVVSAGRSYLPLPLSADEARIILEQTAEDVTAPNVQGSGSPDLANVGWDSHFGWGRVNLGAAVQAIKDGNIPPEASIITPDWFAPLTGASVSFTGVARARRAMGGAFTWRLEWGVGQAPTAWTQVATGTGDASSNGNGTVTDFGTLSLAAVRTAVAAFTPPVDTGDATFSATARHPLKDQITVRLTVTAPGKMPGIDRKTLTIIPDGQALVANSPRRLGTGGEAPIRYADINGDNVQELIVPLVDGTLHAYQPDGSELPGFPVFSKPFERATKHVATPGIASGAVPVPREPFRGPTIASLDNDGKKQIITAAGLHIYVFNADGTAREGFPVRGIDANCTPDKQKQENLHPKCGFVATPAVAWINGRTNKPVIVAPSMDGNLYVWNADGTPVSWSPKRLQDQSIAAADRQVAESIHNPAIGDLNGDGKDDIVVPTNEAYGDSTGPVLPGSPTDVAFGSLSLLATRTYAINGATGAFLPGWPVGVAGLIQDVLPFIGPNADPALMRVGGAQQVILSATGTGISGVGDGLSTYNVAGVKQVEMQQKGKGPASNITDPSGGVNLFESAVVGDLLGTGQPAIVKYQLSLGQVTNLLLVGQNNPYNHMIGAWEPNTGVTLPAWPTITDDYQFLSSSTVAKMVAGTPNQVLAGTGLGMIHAYDGVTGQDVAGFPKVTGGWLFAPQALSDAGRMAAITREGFLYEWQTNHPPCQTEWPSFRHDEQGSGNYNRDGTPPGAVRNLTASTTSGVSLQWLAPGDDALCGTAMRYQVLIDGVAFTGTVPTPVAAGGTQTLALTGLDSNYHVVTVQTVDEAGNLGFPKTIAFGNRPPAPVLIATPSPQGKGRAVSFDASNSADADGDAITQFTYGFGDGTAAVVQAAATPFPTHSYTRSGRYTATLSVKDARGAVSVAAAQAVVDISNAAPVAALVATPSSGKSPLDVRLDASGSSDADPGDAPVFWHFEFGDGSSADSSAPVVMHRYTKPCSCTATVTAFDRENQVSAAASVPVVVMGNLPVAALVVTPNPQGKGRVVTLDGSASRDPDGDALVEYRYTAGDGSAAQLLSTSSTTATYRRSGSYTATLSVKDATGAVSDTVQVVVNVINSKPVAAVTSSSSNGTVPFEVAFNGSGSSDADPADGVKLWRYDFGDGSTVESVAPSVRHTYTTPGSYTARLVVVDEEGAASDAASSSVTAQAVGTPTPIGGMNPQNPVTTTSSGPSGGRFGGGGMGGGALLLLAAVAAMRRRQRNAGERRCIAR